MDRALCRFPFREGADGAIPTEITSSGRRERPKDSSHRIEPTEGDNLSGPPPGGHRVEEGQMSDQNGDRDMPPHVERDEDGNPVVRADGRFYPASEQTPTGDGVTGVSRCPYFCEAETHIHSVEPNLMGHRVSHCAESNRGYFLLKPHTSLFDTPLRWWSENRDDVRRGFDPLYMAFNLGFGGPDAPAIDGPGLFSPEVL